MENDWCVSSKLGLTYEKYGEYSIKNFNAHFIDNYKDIYFNNILDAQKAIEYFNGLLIFNKLINWGDWDV